MAASFALTGCKSEGGGGVAGEATGLLGAGFTMTGGRASALTEEPPEGAWEEGGGTIKAAAGMLRDLDAAMSFSMKECELGLVEQVYTPEPASARVAGERVYRLMTMRDVPVWVRVTWKGAASEGGELLAKRTEQPMEVRVRGGAGGGVTRDATLERRLADALAERLRELARRERARGGGGGT